VELNNNAAAATNIRTKVRAIVERERELGEFQKRDYY